MQDLIRNSQLAERYWFRAISEHIYQSTGIALHGENRSIYFRRVREIADSYKLKSLADFYDRLRFHPENVNYTQELVEHITTGETYFFREFRQLEFFMKKILVPRLTDATTHLPMQIWSAGCSTGDEPYTLAMLALEHAFTRQQLRILGGDINNRALNVARHGVYRESAFRVAPVEARSLYFTQQPDGRYRISERVRDLVEFAWMNLIEYQILEVLPAPDIVFCRNVLIYFDRDAKQRVIANIHRCLRPGGVLLLGHAESLLNLENDFIPDHIDGEIVYRKAEQ